MDAEPLVSVIVPTYKRADKICRAIDSIAAQTYGIENIEVVVVNDNRSEWPERAETDAKLARYAKNLPHFKLVHTAGATGGGAARNLACREATGAYLFFLDDDDEFKPEKIGAQMGFMLAGGYDMSWQDVEWVDERGRLVEHRRLDHVEDFSREGLLRAHVLTPIAPTAIYSLTRELFCRTEGFGEVKVGQDWWLMLRCIEAGARIGYQPGSWVLQYLHDGERLSLGTNKIEGENALYAKKREYAYLLTPVERRFQEFRHCAVLAFACMRSGRMGDAVKYAARAFAASPGACVRKGLDYFGRGKRA